MSDFRDAESELVYLRRYKSQARKRITKLLKCLEDEVLKDHEIAQFVNELNSIAKTYAGTEQMREHISKCVIKWIR